MEGSVGIVAVKGPGQVRRVVARVLPLVLNTIT